MADRVIVFTGLGWGDEGKGGTVHKFASKLNAHTVVRTGAPQAFHRVVTSSGKEHVHAQFGSGTLAGAATHLSQEMMIEPYAILKEGRALQELGVSDVFDKITIHEGALVITPFQAIANRLRELSRGTGRYGSVGVGVGETVLDDELFPEDTICARDLKRPASLLNKLRAVQERKLEECGEIIASIDSLSADARDRARLEVENLKKGSTIEWALGWFKELASLVKIVDTNYFADKIIHQPGTVIFEGSQGVMLDRLYGFHPYITKIRTVPEVALSVIRGVDYLSDITILGILRAYHTRHGAGPFVSEDAELTAKLPDASNGDHPWQGNFRVGSFDLVAAHYAIEACGGPSAFDGLVITCVDRIENLGEWKVCFGYAHPAEGPLIIMDVSHQSGKIQFERQQVIGQFLTRCSPLVMTKKTQGEAVDLCSKVIGDELGIPVVAVSVGPTEKDHIEIEIKAQKTGSAA